MTGAVGEDGVLRIPHHLLDPLLAMTDGEQVEERDRAALAELSVLVDGQVNPLLVNTLDAVTHPIVHGEARVTSPTMRRQLRVFLGRSGAAVLRGLQSGEGTVEVFSTWSDRVPAMLLKAAQVAPRPPLEGLEFRTDPDTLRDLEGHDTAERARAAEELARAAEGSLPAVADHVRGGRWRYASCVLEWESRAAVWGWVDTPAGVVEALGPRQGTRRGPEKTQEIAWAGSSPAAVWCTLIDRWPAGPQIAVTPSLTSPQAGGRADGVTT